ncbi:type I-E CRISPR-associated protein Cas5/CasD [Xylanimonas oleitrophica]|uniref:Type I-E CRISPR-associated protein Cas5/CasD n=1 Tax=Xylanimonas oleitrophica TaxID=2607479 RepID=A0A2W5WTZ7_9MICO|nr:type I-E CRISPR-associated protein Cas5/CasD [Xylanimonas oleitrophica]PZR51716.1 type I-E CRISPR-associated protein Cas5/CasD [Xylanimonas oleitrophica]
MSTLLLRLAGPMQAWGGSSRFTRRSTDHAPTKSGVVGLLAAARGLRRTDPLEELLTLRFGVRIDQPGRVERDFQTARTADGSRAFPLTERFYLTDATFVAAVEGDDSLIAALDEALRRPVFPLYLGRRSCPPAGRLNLGVVHTDLWTALTDLETTEWQAARWWKIKQGKNLELEMLLDAEAVPADVPDADRTPFTQKDTPISYDPRLRQYGLRQVVRTAIAISNPDGRDLAHDPMALLGGA